MALLIAVVLIYYEKWNIEDMPEGYDINILIDAFELFIIPKISQKNKFKLGERIETPWSGKLKHHNHEKVKLFGWEVIPD